MEKNPNSRKQIVALRVGEGLCANHSAPSDIQISKPSVGICYACAIIHNEPVRGK